MDRMVVVRRSARKGRGKYSGSKVARVDELFRESQVWKRIFNCNGDPSKEKKIKFGK